MQTSDRVRKFSIAARKDYLVVGRPPVEFVRYNCQEYTATEWVSVSHIWLETQESTRLRFMQHINNYYATERPPQ